MTTQVQKQKKADDTQIRDCVCDAGYYDEDLSLTRNFLDERPSVRCVPVAPRFGTQYASNATTCEFESFGTGRTQNIDLDLEPRSTAALGAMIQFLSNVQRKAAAIPMHSLTTIRKRL